MEVEVLYLEHIDKFLGLIEDSQYLIKPKKCKIFAEKLEFLGHIISGDGIRPDQAKINKMLDLLNGQKNAKLPKRN
jgi:hypothetical protein